MLGMAMRRGAVHSGWIVLGCIVAAWIVVIYALVRSWL